MFGVPHTPQKQQLPQTPAAQETSADGACTQGHHNIEGLVRKGRKERKKERKRKKERPEEILSLHVLCDICAECVNGVELVPCLVDDCHVVLVSARDTVQQKDDSLALHRHFSLHLDHTLTLLTSTVQRRLEQQKHQ